MVAARGPVGAVTAVTVTTADRVIMVDRAIMVVAAITMGAAAAAETGLHLHLRGRAVTIAGVAMVGMVVGKAIAFQSS
jgi:hypothetical protein